MLRSGLGCILGARILGRWCCPHFFKSSWPTLGSSDLHCSSVVTPGSASSCLTHPTFSVPISLHSILFVAQFGDLIWFSIWPLSNIRMLRLVSSALNTEQARGSLFQDIAPVSRALPGTSCRTSPSALSLPVGGHQKIRAFLCHFSGVSSPQRTPVRTPGVRPASVFQ